jgi:hypothetical protein
MTLRLRSTRATATTNWRRTLVIGVLSLLVSLAPRAADVCQAACAHGRLSHGHAAASTVAAPEHCAHRAGARAASHDLASAHDCGAHAALLDATSANVAFTRGDGQQAAAAAPAAVLAALPSPLYSPPLTRLPIERFAPPPSSARPLTISLRI